MLTTDRTFEYNEHARWILGELSGISSSDVMFGIILFYKYERISESAMCEFFRRLREAVPIPFAERQFSDVGVILEGLSCCTIWSNVINGDPDGWRKSHELIECRRRTFVEKRILPKYEEAFRLLADKFLAQTHVHALVPFPVTS